MNRSYQIFKREFSSYFHTPVAYVFIIIFLIASAGCTFLLGNFYHTNQASLEIFFLFHPWLYLFFIPAIGMRLWSEEKRSGTIELLLNYPVSPTAIVIPKFLAAWAFVAVALFLSFPMVLTVNYLGNADNGMIISGYLGSLLMAGSYLGITSCTSAMTKNQVISFVLSVLTCLIFILLGWGVFNQLLKAIFPGWVSDTITQFSFTTHFRTLQRGIIDSRDVIYFLSLIGFTLMVNVTIINPQRWSDSITRFTLLSLCLVAVNVAAFFVPLRVDITQDQLYTISDGTRKIMDELKEPVTLKLYFSKSSEELPPNLKSYAQRVQELLQEYVQLSHGKLNLKIFDPKPDTEEEEWAEKYGIGHITLSSGNVFYFGLAALQLDRETVIPYLDSQRQEFLEYDISRMILKVSTFKPSKIGLLTSLHMMGTPSYGGLRPTPPWALISELKKNFDLQNLSTTIEEIPDDITTLLLIHPKNLGKRTQYAVDQYVLRGGRLIILLDPRSRIDALTSPMARYGQTDPKSDLPRLLKNWGIAYNASKVVGDLHFATPVNTQKSGVVRYPLWMSLSEAALNSSSPITNQLESLLFAEAGVLSIAENSSVEFTPILQTSIESALVDGYILQFSQPDQIARDFKSDHTTKTLAAIVKSNFKTAFPGGQPTKEKKKGDQGKDKTKEKTEPLKHAHLSQSINSNSIMVIADTDFISDTFSVQRINILGQTIVQPTNDNLNFVLNAVEFLSGNDALMSVRSRGRFSRPFTKVIALEQKAQLRFKQEERLLQQKLETVQGKLSKLENKKDPHQKRLLTAEQQQEIRKFRAEQIQTRKKLRQVRKILRQDIEFLGNVLLSLNLLFIPLLVGFSGVFSYRRRTQKRLLNHT